MIIRLTCVFAIIRSLAFAALPSPEIAPSPILSVMERVADWQLAHPSHWKPIQWHSAAFYTGLMALTDISGSPRFYESMSSIAESSEWKVGPRKYDADDYCVGQAYTELFFRQRDPRALSLLRENLDFIIKHPKSDDLHFVGAEKNDRWAWCDSLFMGPPTWVRLYAATGDKVYLDYAVSHWWQTSDFLYDKHEDLFFRDSTYFDQREANGNKIFWGRGNGWVLAGLVRVLQYLPGNHPARGQFEQQFAAMAARIGALQQPDGLWRASLLDPESYPLKEASGSGFYCYALTWGINQGLLDRARFRPIVDRSWHALVSCVQEDGMVTHIQPVGADPKKFSEDSTEIYGVGALLLAGSELYRMSILSQIPQINIAIKNHGPERIEDLVEVDLSTVKDLPSGELSIMDGSSARILPSTRADQSPSARKNILFLTALDPGEKKRYRVVPSSVLAAVPPIDSKTQPYFFQVLKQRNPSFRQTALQIAIE